MDCDQLKERFSYDPESGAFAYRFTVGRHLRGDRAGTVHHTGYRTICIKGKLYLEHRLAWLYMTGEFPLTVDHIDRDKQNNSWGNLREATRQENRHNCSAKGFFEQKGKFHSRAILGGEQTYLGSFDTANEAHLATRDFLAGKVRPAFQYSMPCS